MKTKTFFILCLFLGIGLTQLSAQPDNKHGTGSVAYDYPNLGWIAGVLCEGVQADLIEGSGDAHVVDHYTNGVMDWEIINFSGTGISDWTGETFTFSEQDKNWIPKPGDWMVSTHVKGNKGSLYYISWVGIWTGNDEDFTWTLKNASCTGNAK
jgi:hypothetical protein